MGKRLRGEISERITGPKSPGRLSVLPALGLSLHLQVPSQPRYTAERDKGCLISTACFGPLMLGVGKGRSLEPMELR